MRFKIGYLVNGGRAVQQPEIDLAAQQPRAVGVKPGNDGLAKAADGGDGADAERNAGQEYPESGETAAQFTPRQPPGEVEIIRHRNRLPRRRCGHRPIARCGYSVTPVPARG